MDKNVIIEKWNKFKSSNKSLLTGREKFTKVNGSPRIECNVILCLGRIAIVKTDKKKQAPKTEALKPDGYITNKRVQPDVIYRANMIIEAWHQGEIRPLRTQKLGYMYFRLGGEWRLLNRGKGFELMSHNKFDTLSDLRY